MNGKSRKISSELRDERFLRVFEASKEPLSGQGNNVQALMGELHSSLLHLVDTNKRLYKELNSCRQMLQEEKEKNDLCYQDFNTLCEQLLVTVNSFEERHNNFSLCTRGKGMEELQALSQLLRLKLKMAVSSHLYQENDPITRESHSENQNVLEENHHLTNKVQNSVKRNIGSHPDISLSLPGALEDDLLAESVDSSSDTIETYRSNYTSSSYDSLYSNDLNASKEQVSCTIKRSCIVPTLSTNKAGAGTWMSGEKNPVEYPQGV